jgi:hypothetical protein
MIEKLHLALYAVFPALIPTPEGCKPTRAEKLNQRLAAAEEHKLAMQLANIESEIALFAANKRVFLINELLDSGD